MRKKSLPIGVLVMVFVVLLAAAGLSYGYWSETITGQGVVSTGELDVSWQSASAVRGGTPGDAACTYDIPNSNLVRFFLTDMHPGANCTLKARIHNGGTVPVTIGINSTPSISGPAVIDTYLITVEDFDCEAEGYIAPGGSILCDGIIGMDPDLTGDTGENMNATYTVQVTASQATSIPTP